MPSGTKTLPRDEDLKVATILNRERLLQNIDQANLGAMVGISQSQISRMLDGTKPATLTEFMQICKALGLIASDVIREAEKIQP